ncbi:MAG: phosphotransferase, partial [Chloroflexota bacterium]
MSEFIQGHTSEWVNYFRSADYPAVRPLASGVEGAIYKLGDGLVAKVWGRRRFAELERMQRFYADTANAALPFATPEILKIESVDGVGVTYERELHGEPLQKHLAAEDPDVEPAAAAALSHVLAALAAVPGTLCMKDVPVLDEEHSMWTGKATFPEAIIGLLDRRMSRFAPVLAPKVEG